MIAFKIQYRGDVPSNLLTRSGQPRPVLRQITKESYRAIGRLWHETMRPKHFTEAGAREYGYRPRKGQDLDLRSKRGRRSYTGRKLRKFGHKLPLVWSGTSRELTRIQDLRVGPKYVRVVLHAPGLNRRNPRSDINMREEMTRVSSGEFRAIAAEFDRQVVRQLKALKTTEIRNISGSVG